MTAPTVDPLAREDVAAADTYRPGEPIWVYRHDVWWPGEIDADGLHGVRVWYQVGRETRVDTVTAEFVMRREAS